MASFPQRWCLSLPGFCRNLSNWLLEVLSEISVVSKFPAMLVFHETLSKFGYLTAFVNIEFCCLKYM